MRKAVVVRMISARGCERCDEVEDRLIAAAKKADVKLALIKLDSTTPEAVTMGVSFGLDDVPSFVISGKAFCGTGFSDDDLVQEMKKAH